MEKQKINLGDTRKRIVIKYFYRPYSNVTAVAKYLNCTKANVVQHCTALIKLGFMKHENSLYFLTKKGAELVNSFQLKSRGDKHFLGGDETPEPPTIKRKTADLHSFNFKFPVEIGQIDLRSIGGRNAKPLNNWTPQYLDIETPFKAVYRNNNNKSITGYLKAMEIYDADTLYSIARGFMSFTIDFFKQHGLILDKEKSYCENFHVEVNDDVAKQNFKKGDKITVSLNKLRGKLTLADPDKQAEAWTDTSPVPSIGTNDPDWWKAYLDMPLSIRQLLTIFSRLENVMLLEIENKKLHQGVLQDISKTMTQIKDYIVKDEQTPSLDEKLLKILNKVINKGEIFRQDIKDQIVALSMGERARFSELYMEKFKD